MAYWYYASIRCGNKYQAKFLAEKYHGQTFTFNVPNTLMAVPARMRGESKPDADDPNGHWAEIGVLEITDNGIGTPDEADQANQFDNVMYGMLRNESFFDYAVIGVETGEFRTLDELRKDFADGSVVKLHGLVVRTALLKEFIGENALIPPEFVPFSPTHHWIPKRPEVHRQ